MSSREHVQMERVYQRVIQEMITEIVVLCPWMEEADVARVETVFTAHMGLVAGEAADVGMMASALSALSRRAEVMGDRRRAWAFEQWYWWACASLRGEEYRELELPAELAALP